MFGDPDYKITAVYDHQGIPTMKVAVVIPYGSRSATHIIEVTDEKFLKEFSDLSKKIIHGLAKDATVEATSHAARALVHAVEGGEKL